MRKLIVELFLGIFDIIKKLGDPLKEIDISKHELAPKHTILNEKEKEEVLDKFKITLRQLPRISDTDAQIKILSGKPGDVVRIIRKSQTAGEMIYYRVVIKG